MDYRKEYGKLKERNAMLLETISNLNKSHEELIIEYKKRLDVIYRLIK